MHSAVHWHLASPIPVAVCVPCLPFARTHAHTHTHTVHVTPHTSDKAFTGFVGFDGPFICKGQFCVELPLGTMKSLQSVQPPPTPLPVATVSTPQLTRSTTPSLAQPRATTAAATATGTVLPSGAGAAAPVTVTLSPAPAKTPRPQSPHALVMPSGARIFNTVIPDDAFLTLPQIQNAVNYIKFADVLLTPFSAPPPAAAPQQQQAATGDSPARPAGISVYQCQRSDLSEVNEALTWIIQAWRLLAHQPVDSMFPNRIVASNAAVFDPPLPQDLLIEAAVASGEAILHMFVLASLARSLLNSAAVSHAVSSTGTCSSTTARTAATARRRRQDRCSPASCRRSR